MSKVKALLPNGQETELEIEEVTLLSVDEATRTPKRLLKNRDYWWLCSPGASVISVWWRAWTATTVIFTTMASS